MCHCGNTGVEWTSNTSQPRQLTLEKTILLLLLPGFKLITFWSWVWHSTHWAILTPHSELRWRSITGGHCHNLKVATAKFCTVKYTLAAASLYLHCQVYVYSCKSAVVMKTCMLTDASLNLRVAATTFCTVRCMFTAASLHLRVVAATFCTAKCMFMAASLHLRVAAATFYTVKCMFTAASLCILEL